MSATSTSSAASTGSPKVSMFAGKSGFVIPKNKLSGSLIPIFRGKKPGENDENKEDSTNQTQRKTKWGPHPTQDTAVRKGRALAYMTRVDQISEQLKSGIPEPERDQDSMVADQHAKSKSSGPLIDDKNSDLELERREAIGEILKLNPSYKAPSDYTPLLKEATIPIPVKEHPGFDFIGLIFGSRSETLKRLEKETGAKIQLYGTRTNALEKVKISPDAGETQVSYEELIVHLSAESFEKVDAAIALIELLITSVSGNSASGNKENFSQTQEATTPMVPIVANQELAPPVVGPRPTPQQGQFQYQNTWFQPVTPQAPAQPPLNLIHNYSTSPFNNPVHFQSHLNPSTMPPLFGQRPVPVSGHNSTLQSPSPLPFRPSGQGFADTYSPRNFPMPASQPSSAQANILASRPFTGSQYQPTGLPPISRPLMSSLPEHSSTVFRGPQSGWPGAPLGAPTSGGAVSMGQSSPVVAQPGLPPSAPSLNMTAANGVSPVNFTPRPTNLHLSSVPMNHPTAAPISSSLAPLQVGHSATSRSMQSFPQVMDIIPPANPSKYPLSSSPMMSAAQPILQSIGPFSGATANFTSGRPPSAAAPKPLHSGTGDFTFHAHSHNPTSQAMRHSHQLPNMMTPQSPSFRFPLPNSTAQPGMNTFPRPQVSNQMGHTRPHLPAVPFAGNHMGGPVPPRTAVLPMGSRNFGPAPRLSNLVGPFPPGARASSQLQQNYPTATTPRGILMAVNQFNNNPSFAAGRPVSNPGGQQVYDPFSPTSVAIAHQRQADDLAKARKQENDPEYDDLMASVGVK